MARRSTFAPHRTVGAAFQARCGRRVVGAGKQDMNFVFLFEIDGSLAEPGRPMSPGMAVSLFDLACRQPIYLFSAGDWDTVSAQVPNWLRAEVRGIFVAAGAEFWRRDRQMAVRTRRRRPANRGNASGRVAPAEWVWTEVLPWLRSTHPEAPITVVAGRPGLLAQEPPLADALPVLGDGFNTVAVHGPTHTLVAVADILQEDECWRLGRDLLAGEIE